MGVGCVGLVADNITVNTVKRVKIGERTAVISIFKHLVRGLEGIHTLYYKAPFAFTGEHGKLLKGRAFPWYAVILAEDKAQVAAVKLTEGNALFLSLVKDISNRGYFLGTSAYKVGKVMDILIFKGLAIRTVSVKVVAYSEALFIFIKLDYSFAA